VLPSGTALASTARRGRLDLVPKPPNRTLANERFIALHMMTDRMKPDDPIECAGNDEEFVIERERPHGAGGQALRREFRSAITVGHISARRSA